MGVGDLTLTGVDSRHIVSKGASDCGAVEGDGLILVDSLEGAPSW